MMARSDDEGCIKYGYHDHIQALGFLVSDPRLVVVVSLFSTGTAAHFINTRIADCCHNLEVASFKPINSQCNIKERGLLFWSSVVY